MSMPLHWWHVWAAVITLCVREVLLCLSWVCGDLMWQADRQTGRQRDRHTDMQTKCCHSTSYKFQSVPTGIIHNLSCLSHNNIFNTKCYSNQALFTLAVWHVLYRYPIIAIVSQSDTVLPLKAPMDLNWFKLQGCGELWNYERLEQTTLTCYH
jgi:hypothetical protein